MAINQETVSDASRAIAFADDVRAVYYQSKEMVAKIEHLEARRGALIAEVDRLAARDRDAGVVIEDLRKMLATARLDGAREMRELTAAVAQEAGGRLTPAEIRALPLTGGAQ